MIRFLSKTPADPIRSLGFVGRFISSFLKFNLWDVLGFLEKVLTPPPLFEKQSCVSVKEIDHEILVTRIWFNLLSFSKQCIIKEWFKTLRTIASLFCNMLLQRSWYGVLFNKGLNKRAFNWMKTPGSTW